MYIYIYIVMRMSVWYIAYIALKETVAVSWKSLIATLSMICVEIFWGVVVQGQVKPWCPPISTNQ